MFEFGYFYYFGHWLLRLPVLLLRQYNCNLCVADGDDCTVLIPLAVLPTNFCPWIDGKFRSGLSFVRCVAADECVVLCCPAHLLENEPRCKAKPDVAHPFNYYNWSVNWSDYASIDSDDLFALLWAQRCAAVALLAVRRDLADGTRTHVKCVDWSSIMPTNWLLRQRQLMDRKTNFRSFIYCHSSYRLCKLVWQNR